MVGGLHIFLGSIGTYICQYTYTNISHFLCVDDCRCTLIYTHVYVYAYTCAQLCTHSARLPSQSRERFEFEHLRVDMALLHESCDPT